MNSQTKGKHRRDRRDRRDRQSRQEKRNPAPNVSLPLGQDSNTNIKYMLTMTDYLQSQTSFGKQFVKRWQRFEREERPTGKYPFLILKRDLFGDISAGDIKNEQYLQVASKLVETWQEHLVECVCNDKTFIYHSPNHQAYMIFNKPQSSNSKLDPIVVGKALRDLAYLYDLSRRYGIREQWLVQTAIVQSFTVFKSYDACMTSALLSCGTDKFLQEADAALECLQLSMCIEIAKTMPDVKEFRKVLATSQSWSDIVDKTTPVSVFMHRYYGFHPMVYEYLVEHPLVTLGFDMTLSEIDRVSYDVRTLQHCFQLVSASCSDFRQMGNLRDLEHAREATRRILQRGDVHRLAGGRCQAADELERFLEKRVCMDMKKRQAQDQKICQDNQLFQVQKQVIKQKVVDHCSLLNQQQATRFWNKTVKNYCKERALYPKEFVLLYALPECLTRVETMIEMVKFIADQLVKIGPIDKTQLPDEFSIINEMD